MSGKKRQMDKMDISPRISQYFTPSGSISDRTEMDIDENSDMPLENLTRQSVLTGIGEAGQDSQESLPQAAGGKEREKDEDEPRAEKKRKINGDQKVQASTTTEDILAKLLDRMDQMNSKFNDIVARLDLSLTQIDNNKREIEEVKEKQEGIEFDIGSIKEKLHAQEKENEKLRERMTDLSARGMRNTLVFQGFPEGAENKNCENLIQSFAKSHLQIEAEVIIERAHRSGSTSSPRPRPIIAAFNRYSTKNMILVNARRFLKEKPFEHNGKHPIYVDEMLPKEIREQRKKLIHIKKKLKEENTRRVVYFKYPARIFYKEGKDGKEREYKMK
ncbi:uncharacterized protein LOC121421147 [Lytechinus variegatus]|uniref:uncharacterized protein LOC121421147 n=2 Tax=Lytechinus variegatus TaxID=7654 RepID=UPI001BB1AC4E|nr:uncharacterized protein LOC121421147 [Lytechinus variegatus]